MKQKITLLVLAAICVFRANAQVMLLQSFNSTASVTAAGWGKVNNSSPVGSTSWFIGNPSVFVASSGPDSAYFAANYNSTQGSNGTINSWLISPTVTVDNGGVLQFATRTNTAAPQNVAPDRLQVYLSLGTGSNVGGTSTSVGTFSTLLVSVNPSLTNNGYPTTWTVYTATLAGLTGTATGRFGFRYNMPSAGPTGTNSSYIGIDDVSFMIPCPNPTLSVSASTTDICSGSLVTLTVTGANTYTWSGGQTTSTVNVSPSASTVYTVTGSSTPNCNSTETIAITVTVTPSLAVSDVTTCAGTAATLIASGASSYSWSTGATTATIVETPTMTTTYSVTGYNGVCEGTAFVTVTLGSSLSINATVNNATVCSGQPATLTATGASSYSWMPGNAQGANAAVTPTSSTNYTVTGISGACAGEATVGVIVLPTPSTISIVASSPLTAGGVTLCPNSALTLTASATGAGTYSWSGSTSTTSIRALITPSSTGTYTYGVVATTTNGCSRSAAVSVIVNACTGIESIDANAAASVFPNPFGQELNISGVSGRIEVYNALGQVVLKQAVTQKETLNTESFAKGVYILKAYNAENKVISTMKLIKN